MEGTNRIKAEGVKVGDIIFSPFIHPDTFSLDPYSLQGPRRVVRVVEARSTVRGKSGRVTDVRVTTVPAPDPDGVGGSEDDVYYLAPDDPVHRYSGPLAEVVA